MNMKVFLLQCSVLPTENALLGEKLEHELYLCF